MAGRAGLALQSHGHSVHFFTSHHDPSHAFKETTDGTLPVTVHGDWMPRHVCGYLHAVWAYLRMIYLALAFWAMAARKYDVIFCDQISVCLPFLRLCGLPVVFYCHFPDQVRRSRLAHACDPGCFLLTWNRIRSCWLRASRR